MKDKFKFYILFIISNILATIISTGLVLLIHSSYTGNDLFTKYSRYIINNYHWSIFLISIILFFLISYIIQFKWLNKIIIPDKFYSNLLRYTFFIIFITVINSIPKLTQAIHNSKIGMSISRINAIKKIIMDYKKTNKQLPDISDLSKYNDLFIGDYDWKITYSHNFEFFDKYYSQDNNSISKTDSYYILFIEINKSYLIYDNRSDKIFWLIKQKNKFEKMDDNIIYIKPIELYKNI